MSEVALSTLKEHVGASGFTDDDVLLQGYLDASELHVVNHLRRDMATDFPDGWPADVTQAALLLAAHFYDNRGGQADATGQGLPVWFRDLLAPYRDLS
jgi:hypothetical protein